MTNPELTPAAQTLTDIVCDKYEILDEYLHSVFATKQTFEDETLLDPSVRSTTIYKAIQSVTAAHSLYNSDGMVQKAAFEAFWLAVQIASVLPNKPVFNPGQYFQSMPEELYKQMAEDALCYLENKPYISTLIDEHVDGIDPSGVHTVIVESFAAVTIMLIEQNVCSEPDINEDIELEKEFARLLLYVDGPFQN